MKFNSYRDLIEYVNKEGNYNDLIIEAFENFISSNKDTFVEDENVEPSNLFDLKIKDKIFSFGVTSMFLRKGEIKYYYWIYTCK